MPKVKTLSGKMTLTKKLLFFGKLFRTTVVSMATNSKVIFDTNKEVKTKILDFGKLFRTTVVSMTKTSYNKLKFLNLVTMATMKIV